MTDETKRPASKRAKGRTARDEARRCKVNVLTDEDTRKLMGGIKEAMVAAMVDKLMDELIARYNAATAAGERDPRFVAFDGWNGIAEAIGVPRDVHMFRMIEDALHAGSQMRWEFPELEGFGLWTYTVTPGPKPVLAVILGDALVPVVVPTVDPVKLLGDD